MQIIYGFIDCGKLSEKTQKKVDDWTHVECLSISFDLLLAFYFIV